MDFILHRYKNLTLLLVVIAAQLVLLAYQVKSNQDMRLIRVWSVTAITPVARLVELIRGGTVGFMKDYFILLDAREENRRLREEMGRVKMENQFLQTELSTADRARALAAFQARTPSKTLAARIIANATGANSKVVYIDRGVAAGVQPGMAVVTPDGIVGKVIAVYPTASQVMLITDPSFAAGVISQKYRVHGTLKGQGHGTLIVDYVPSELKVEVGEKFFTSGDDRIFPKGLPVGEVKVVRPGRSYKEIFVAPSGFSQGLEEVLVIVNGVHQMIPGATPEQAPYHVLPSPEQEPEKPAPTTVSEGPATEADRLKEYYLKLGQAQGVHYGAAGRIPDFNAPIEPPKPPAVSPEGTPPAAPPQQ
ncbi:MAG: rod shape-determining protein MreC [Bryobacterales bacterium]|nr:rod shape-determining protein MreC [Bryobacterales bacterium]